MAHTLSTKNVEMKEPTPRWQFWTAFATLLIGLISMWISLSGTIKQDGRDYENHEQRIQGLEKRFDKLENKIDKISDQNTQILILLQNKADRK